METSTMETSVKINARARNARVTVPMPAMTPSNGREEEEEPPVTVKVESVYV